MLLLYFRTRTSPGHVNSTKIIKRNIFWCMINLASCQLEIASFIIYQDYISLIWLLSGTIDSGNCLNSNFDIVKNVSFKNGHFSGPIDRNCDCAYGIICFFQKSIRKNCTTCNKVISASCFLLESFAY